MRVNYDWTLEYLLLALKAPTVWFRFTATSGVMTHTVDAGEW